MRTTIRIDDALLREAKAFAARTGRSLTALIEDALRQVLSQAPRPRGDRFEMVTFRGRGLQPGVDLDDTAALQDILESDGSS